ncbi:hypothetical protein EMPS_09854 [Entomortierella parvispora]|uniref:Uncharacterized protein n=1 Tax=Entomortierella parvispora TaxID=205924 RepID=A0A9P3HJ25_9FUNG|nr:hypothetical protein EMPS_09854 [Entomortierella parvispora]
MAGFKDGPFSLPRNVVPPPRNLQKSVFPFIEDALFEPGTYQHTVWTSKVDREMLDASNEAEAASFDLLPYHVETRQRTRGPESIRDYPSQQSFLLMLARLRHVVLQDAAEYMWIQDRHSNWKGTKFPLFEAHKDIFNSPAFIEYRQKVWDELDRHNLDSDNDERQTLPIASSPSPSAVGLQSLQPSNEQSVGTLRQLHHIQNAIDRLHHQQEQIARAMEDMQNALLQLKYRQSTTPTLAPVTPTATPRMPQSEAMSDRTLVAGSSVQDQDGEDSGGSDEERDMDDGIPSLPLSRSGPRQSLTPHRPKGDSPLPLHPLAREPTHSRIPRLPLPDRPLGQRLPSQQPTEGLLQALPPSRLISFSPILEGVGNPRLTVQEIWDEQQNFKRAKLLGHFIHSDKTLTNRRNISRFIEYLVHSNKATSVAEAIEYVQRIRDREPRASSTDKLWRYCRDALDIAKQKDAQDKRAAKGKGKHIAHQGSE